MGGEAGGDGGGVGVAVLAGVEGEASEGEVGVRGGGATGAEVEGGGRR